MKYSKITLSVFLLMISNWIEAAELCVTNSAELRNAFAIANGDNEDDVVV